MTDKQGSASGTGQESGAGGSGPSDSSQSGTNTANGANPPAGTQGQTNSPGGIDAAALFARIDSLEKGLKDARADAAKYRTKLKALASEDDSQGEQGKGGNALPPEMAQSLQKLREGRIKDQLTLAATGAGAHNPNEIYRFLDMAEIATDDGTVEKPEKLMEDLRKSHPYLFKPPVQGSADGQSGSGNLGKPGDMNTIIREGFRSLRGSPR
jgi:hypothetical protein